MTRINWLGLRRSCRRTWVSGAAHDEPAISVYAAERRSQGLGCEDRPSSYNVAWQVHDLGLCPRASCHLTGVYLLVQARPEHATPS